MEVSAISQKLFCNSANIFETVNERLPNLLTLVAITSEWRDEFHSRFYPGGGQLRALKRRRFDEVTNLVMIGQSTADPAETAAIGLGTTAHTGARYVNHMSYYDLFHRKLYEILERFGEKG